MGWNVVVPTTSNALTDNLPGESRFYFVHSYYVQVDHVENSILKCTYGVSFDAAVNKGNVYGAQFHPEKSHKFGMDLLKNYLAI
jgi:glutamine amidotransferase